MSKPPKQPAKLADLPVLTELSVTHAALPVLTEILSQEPSPAKPDITTLSDAQCRQLAAQIAPHLEALLRDKLAARLDALWPEIWREVQLELPKLIRAQLAVPARRARK